MIRFYNLLKKLKILNVGVKRMIWSMFFLGFDIIIGVIIDYMYCVLFGIIKMVLILWIDKFYFV